jgi:hypothetical protein
MRALSSPAKAGDPVDEKDRLPDALDAPLEFTPDLIRGGA